jgi:plastocyanin
MNKKITIALAIIALALLAFAVITSMQKKPVPVVAPADVPANIVTAPNPSNENKPINNPAEVAAAQTYQVSIKNFAFSPSTLNIKKGDTVVWTNEDRAPHQIEGSNFKSDVFQNGATYSFTFKETGKFSYICSIHPSMKGEIAAE